MELYCAIGRLGSGRRSKGAAVAAAEHLCGMYPDASGLSPRNPRRTRAFYRTYESSPEVLAQTMAIGWTRNVVILKEEPVKLVAEILGTPQRETVEAELILREPAWYIRTVQRFEWSKLELRRKIAAGAHLEISLDFTGGMCYAEKKNGVMERTANDENPLYLPRKMCLAPFAPVFAFPSSGKPASENPMQ